MMFKDKTIKIKLITNTGLYESGCLSFRMVRVSDVSNYFITLKNNGGHCHNCEVYVSSIEEFYTRRIIFDKKQIVFYRVGKFRCECRKDSNKMSSSIRKEDR